MPRKRGGDCLKELGPARCAAQGQTRAGLKASVERGPSRYPKRVAWVEENIAEALTYFSLPRAYPKNMKSTNMLERLPEEIERRTRVVGVFPNDASCPRLARALASAQHESRQEDNRCIDMTLLKEKKREGLKAAA